MKINFQKNWQLFTLLILFIPFIVFQISIIDRPFYWDEAWSYATAVEAMYKNGPSLLPGAINPDLYRGHPTFFYFITTVWMKVFGPSLASIHSFFLLISCVLIAAVFKLGDLLGGKTVGLIASACLMSAPLFISQAGFLLPEVMLALFSVLTVYFYFKQKIVLEILFGTLLLYTKETGLVLIASILLFDFTKRAINSKSIRGFFEELPPFFLHLIPIAMVSVFFILQKIKLGWFFFPEHMGMMTFEPNMLKYKFIQITKYLLKEEGRFLLSLFLAVTFILFLIKKEKQKKQLHFIIFSILFIVLYIIFSILNFYTIRYNMSIFPFLFLAFGVLVYHISEKYKVLILLPVIAFMALSLKYSIKPEGVGDRTIGFLKMVDVMQQTVTYCEENKLHDKEIGVCFNMYYYLTEPFLGYISINREFSKINSYKDSKLDYAIITSIELSETAISIQQSNKFVLINRIGQDSMFCEIYQKNNAISIQP